MRKIVWCALVAASISTGASAQEAARFDVAAPSGQAAGQAPAGGSASAPAQAAAPPAPAKRLTLTAGADVPTAYVFRGLLQEDEDFIFQPAVDLGIALYEGSGALTAVTANVGNWNSMHGGPTGGDLNDGSWYEADLYGSVTFAFGKFKPGVLFTSYLSPNDGFNSVHELAGVFAYDDSANVFPLNPKAILAFELDGQADGGDGKGTYLELGIRPVVKVAAPLSLAIPVKLGLSLNDYYEGATGSNTFGYFDTGLIASVPLPSTGDVSWELHGGVDLLWLGDNTKILNGDDGFKPVGVFGFTLTY